MKIMAFNGSPRKKHNTDILLNKALEGAKSKGADTELIHLYDYNYKGCKSCFSCKLINGKSYGKCAMNDELTAILKRASEADALIFGAPIYFGLITGEMKSMLERLLFPFLVYDKEGSSLFGRKIPTGFIYTFNANEKRMEEIGYDKPCRYFDIFLKMVFGHSEYLMVTDTYQFDDYSKYVNTRYDPMEKAKRRDEVFPLDCQKAYEMGIRFTNI
jgi:multimeric flavodoxin WrbA